MKIKSLLLGSAAALVAASAAQAADAIIVEPEPVEYVRVCDAYGSGWFYIPGTETCLKISGYVRSTYAHIEREYEANDSNYVAGGNNSRNESDWDYRGRLNIQANNETEYGTLTSYLRLQGGDAPGNADAAVGIDRALITLAGFRLGYSDTYYATNHGYAVGSPLTGAKVADTYYGYDQAIFFDYTWAQDGFAVTVGVQDTANTTDRLDMYAGVNWATDFGTLAFTWINDNTADDDTYKVSAIIPMGDSGWNVGAFYAWDDEGTSRYTRAYTNNAIDQEWGVAVWGAVADNMTLYGAYSEASSDIDGGGSAAITGAQFHTWTVGAAWRPVSGLTVNFEYATEEREGDFGAANVIDDTRDAYVVRVTRSW